MEQNKKKIERKKRVKRVWQLLLYNDTALIVIPYELFPKGQTGTLVNRKNFVPKK